MIFLFTPEFFQDANGKREDKKAADRQKRSVFPGGFSSLMSLEPWKCPRKEGWVDLGPDHYPRYIRNTTCLTDSCFFGRCACIPRGFALKVLKRLSDKCVELGDGRRPELGGAESMRLGAEMPYGILDAAGPNLEEPWVFEEISITFCCECALWEEAPPQRPRRP